MVVVVGDARLWWWCLAVLSYSDVGGGAGFVWLAVGVINCSDYGLKRERERESGERKNIKIMYRKATVTVHICTITVAVVYICILL